MGVAEASPAPAPAFARSLFDPERRVSRIGGGALGGKADGLLFLDRLLRSRALSAPGLAFDVPALAVLGSDVFEAFLERNGLRELLMDEASEEVIRDRFRRAALPAEITGDLWSLAAEARVPLAIRSSSVLEDDSGHPLAGVYGTKLIPGNQPAAEARFGALVDAVKFVYASALFRSARDGRRAAGLSGGDERMAVIVQEVVGLPRGARFYPDVSAVLRSLNVYPTGPARAEDGVVMLALGLGKTIVDGGLSWSFAPPYPTARPPFGSAGALLKATQTRFWSVSTGPPPRHDPMAETEYLVQADLAAAEEDGVLSRLASTYDPASERIVMGTGRQGPRVLDFAPLLSEGALPAACAALLGACEDAAGGPVEMEVALSLPRGRPGRFGLLQARPVLVGRELVEVAEEALVPGRALVASRSALGNGRREVQDVLLVDRRSFAVRDTPAIAAELRLLNGSLAATGRRYLLVGFGRFGSADPFLGIPVRWEDIAGAAAIVEAALPELRPDPSQGSHFFHNLVASGTAYLTAPLGGGIDWEALEGLEPVARTEHVCHLRSAVPLSIEVDGRCGRAVVRRGGDGEGR